MTNEETSAALTAILSARGISLPGRRIHRLYSYRQVGSPTTVLLTADCGEVLNLADVQGHGIGPTCKRCKGGTVTGRGGLT